MKEIIGMKDTICIKDIQEYTRKKLMEASKHKKEGEEYRFLTEYKIVMCRFVKGKDKFETVGEEHIVFSNLIVEEEKKKIDEAIGKLREEGK